MAGGLVLDAAVKAAMLPFKQLTEQARLPSYGSYGAAGLDLYADFTHETGDAYALPYGEHKLFKTGIAVAIPPGYYGRIAPRSGLSMKGLSVGGGVIDSDYRGEIGVILAHTSTPVPADGFRALDVIGRPERPESIVIKHGDRIAQLILEKIITPQPFWADDLDETARGEGGFGSTG